MLESKNFTNPSVSYSEQGFPSYAYILIPAALIFLAQQHLPHYKSSTSFAFYFLQNSMSLLFKSYEQQPTISSFFLLLTSSYTSSLLPNIPLLKKYPHTPTMIRTTTINEFLIHLAFIVGNLIGGLRANEVLLYQFWMQSLQSRDLAVDGLILSSYIIVIWVYYYFFIGRSILDFIYFIINLGGCFMNFWVVMRKNKEKLTRSLCYDRYTEFRKSMFKFKSLLSANHKIMSSSYPKNTKLNSFSPRTNFSPIDEALETSTDINQQPTHQQSHPQTINQNHHHESKFAIVLIISTIFSIVCMAVLIKKSLTVPVQSSIPELEPGPVPGPIPQQVPMPVKNLCLDWGYNARYFDNLYEYLVHNKIKTVLDVGYDEQCMLEFLEKGDESLDVKYADLMDEESEREVYDWLIIEGVYTFFQQFMQQNNSLDGYVKFGVSIRQRNMKFNNDVAEKQMQEYFASIGFIYDQAKSLSLRRPQNKLIYIFLVNDTLPQTYPEPIQGLSIPDRNFLSISTILKLRQNIPYLRQWLGYHIHIGFDKFFIYDNSNASKYFYDPLVTKTQNRYGMDIRCVNFTEQQLNTEWKKIWQQFYDHIVYIKWEPKDENGNIIYGQVQAQQDYLKYFRNVVRYTAFTDTDEMIYSEQDRNVKDYILSKAKFNVTLFYLVQRHFQCRFCVKNSRVTDIEYYFNQNNGIWWGPKIIAETKYFISLSSIHQGEVSQGQKVGLPSKQLRFNHYNFELFNLGMARARNFSDSTRFQIDAGMRRYRNVMDEVCRGETCSERFQLQCPEGLQYRNCLNTEKQYPLDIQFKLPSDFVDARPSQPNKQFQYPKYKPITPPKEANISTLTAEFYQQLRQNYSCEYIVTITNQIISNSSLMLQTKYEAPLFLVFSILSKNQISLNWEGSSLKCAVFAEPEYRNAFLYQPSIGQYFILQNQRSEILTNIQTFIKQKKQDNNLLIQQQIIKDNKFLIIAKQSEIDPL